jgi:RNA polymerase sigma-70 factor (ECF subfamily)
MKIIISELQYKKLISNDRIKESVEPEIETSSINFDVVYKDCYPKIFKQICLRYSDGDYEKAQDYCQDGFIRAYQKQEQFTGTNVCGWISSIMRNYIIDEIRKENRRGTKVNIDKVKLGSYDIDMGDDLGDEFYSKKYSPDDVKAAIDDLSPQYKNVFIKYYVEGLPHQQIADELGINAGTSKSNAFKARKNVLDYLKNLKRD